MLDVELLGLRYYICIINLKIIGYSCTFFQIVDQTKNITLFCYSAGAVGFFLVHYYKEYLAYPYIS